MSWMDCFKKENYPKVKKVLSTRELIHLADRALEEDPDNNLIKGYKDQLLKELEAERNKKVLLKDINDYLNGRL